MLREIAAAHGVTPNQVILAWLVQQEPPIIPVMAASTDARMAENLAALDLKLTAGEMETLNGAGA